MMTRATLGLLAALSLASPASAQTAVPAGNLVGSQTWTTAGSPYTLGGDVTVPVGITLSIQPGVEIRMGSGDTSGSGLDTARTELRVAGTLAIAGTAATPVRMVSTAASPAAGAYYGVVALAGATVNITSFEVQYAQRAVYSLATGVVISDLRSTTANMGLEVAGGSTSLSASRITGSTSYGVYVTGGTFTGTGLTLAQNTSYGIYCSNAPCAVDRSLLRANGSRGVYYRVDSGTHTQSITHSTIVGHSSYGVYVFRSAGTQAVVVRDNVIVDNGSTGLYVAGGPTPTVSNNLTFGQATPYNGVSAGTGAVNENPLLVDSANQDYRPTSRSGARNGASDGTDIGAFPYDGALTGSLVGHLFQNTTLTAAASPHLVTGDLTVEPGVTLTIEPGAELRFANGADAMGAGIDVALTELRVRGTLVADGTTTLGIRFVSANATPAAGDWYGVVLLAGASPSVVDFATIRHARYGIHSSAGAGTVVSRSTIELSASYGVFADAGGLDLSEVVLRSNTSYGAYYSNASGTIQRCRLHDNGSRGLYLRTDSGTQSLQVLHNTIVGHSSYGIYVFRSAGTQSITLRDNLVVSNGSTGIYVAGGPTAVVDHNLVWGQATPYNGVSAGAGAVNESALLVNEAQRDLRITSSSAARRHASDGGDIGALPFDGALTVGVQGHLYDATTWSGTVDVLGDVTVEPGVTLTIQPGTTVRFAANTDSVGANTTTTDAELVVLGRLVADGTPQSRITFTSNAPSPAAGDWYGVELTAGAANSTVDNAVIEWATYGVHSQAPATVTVSQSEIRRSSSYGAFIDGGALNLAGVYLHDNTSYGIYATNASPTLTNLLIVRNGSRGLYYRTDSGSTTLVANHLTVYGHSSYGIYVFRSAGTQSLTLRNSIISDNGSTGVYVAGGPTVTLSNNDVWGQATPYNGVSAGANSLAANPQFVDPMLDNFHLLPNSPAIDAGLAGTADDLEGGSRAVDGDMNGSQLPDLGAYEFNPSSNRWPVADAGADRVVTSGLSATFSGAGSLDPDGTIATWVWDFGDGTPSASGSMVSHTFSGGTDRVVTLTVTDNAGAVDVDTVNVEVNLPPTASAGADRFADPAEVITFSASGSADSDGTIASYAWNFGDGAQGSGASATHAYAAGGTYTVTLTVTDDDGATATDVALANITGGDGAPPTIAHTPVAGGRPANAAVVIAADVSDASGVQSATLYYRATGGGAFTAAAMSNVGGNTYQATIPAGAVTVAGVDYYLQAVDNAAAHNTGRSPAGAPAAWHAFTVTAPALPSISHTPVANGQRAGQAVTITAMVTAPQALASARLFHRLQGGGAFTMVTLTSGGGGSYSAQIPGAAVAAPAVEYYLEVIDTAVPPNTVTSPGAGGVHAFTVTAADTSPPSIVHTPVTNGQPENAAVMVSATVTDPSGVTSVTLRYRVSGGGAFATAAMTDAGGGNYAGAIPAAAVTRAGVDYYVAASDGASPANAGAHPATAPGTFHTFTVTRTFAVSEGDLIVSEIMNDPSGTESQREWLELYNTTNAPIDLVGFELADDGTDDFTVTSATPVLVPAHGYLVLGRSADTALNGGVTVGYVYSGFALSNTADEVIIRAGALVVDRVAYDGGATFPHVPGRSITLDPTTLDYAANDDGSSWCTGSTPLSGGDFGTPGAANDACQAAVDNTAPAIVHTPIASGQQAGVAVTVNAVITDPSGVGVAELFHRPATGGAFTRVAMTALGNGNYQAVIAGASVTVAGVQYYLRAADAAPAANEAFEPAMGVAAPHTFQVTATDTSGPAITHAPLTGPVPAGAALTVRASIVDPSGVAGATLYYRSNMGSYTSVAMTAAGSDYSAVIPAIAVVEPTVEYYLEARDAATPANASTLPAMAMASPFSVAVQAVDTTPPVITHTPVADGRPQGQAVSIVADVSDASGVAEVTVYVRAAGTGAFVSAALSPAGGGRYTGEIPGALVMGAGVDYYLEATDASPDDNRGQLPATAPAAVFSFTVAGPGEDTAAPVIAHTPISGEQPRDTAITVVATITDDAGVAGAYVLYRVRGEADFTRLDMMEAPVGDEWSVKIPAEAVLPPGLEYYLAAVDASPNANTARLPAAAPAEVLGFDVSGGASPSPSPTNPPDLIERGGGCACATDDAPVGLTWLVGLLLLAWRARRRHSPRQSS